MYINLTSSKHAFIWQSLAIGKRPSRSSWNYFRSSGSLLAALQSTVSFKNNLVKVFSHLLTCRLKNDILSYMECWNILVDVLHGINHIYLHACSHFSTALLMEPPTREIIRNKQSTVQSVLCD